MLTKWILLPICAVALFFASYFFFLNKSDFNPSNPPDDNEFSNIEIIDTLVPKPTLPPVPQSKILTGGNHVFQTFNNCGPAALSMTLSYYGIFVSQEVLGDEIRPYQIAGGVNDDKSATLYELARKGQEYGFAAYHRPGGDVNLISHFLANDIPVITRTLTAVGEDIGHFRVIKGYDEHRRVVIQDDSLQGKDLEYSYDEFRNLWAAFSYEYLVLIPKEKVERAELIMGENLDEETAWKNALKASERQILTDPNDIYAKFNKHVALYNLGQYSEAIKIYEQIESSLPPRTLWYQIEPIVAYQKLGMYGKVLEMTDKLIWNENRAFSEVYQIRAEIYESQGNSELAKENFDKTIFYNKNFYKYWR